MSIYIIFCLIVIILLFLLVYKVYICILALRNSTAELSSLYPYGVVWTFGFVTNQERTKALSVTKCHLEVFLNVVFYIHFHIVAIVMSSFCLF